MEIQDAGRWASLRALRALCGKNRNMTEKEEGVGCRRGIYGAARDEWRMAGGQLRTRWEELLEAVESTDLLSRHEGIQLAVDVLAYPSQIHGSGEPYQLQMICRAVPLSHSRERELVKIWADHETKRRNQFGVRAHSRVTLNARTPVRHCSSRTAYAQRTGYSGGIGSSEASRAESDVDVRSIARARRMETCAGRLGLQKLGQSAEKKTRTHRMTSSPSFTCPRPSLRRSNPTPLHIHIRRARARGRPPQRSGRHGVIADGGGHERGESQETLGEAVLKVGARRDPNRPAARNTLAGAGARQKGTYQHKNGRRALRELERSGRDGGGKRGCSERGPVGFSRICLSEKLHLRGISRYKQLDKQERRVEALGPTSCGCTMKRELGVDRGMGLNRVARRRQRPSNCGCGKWSRIRAGHGNRARHWNESAIVSQANEGKVSLETCSGGAPQGSRSRVNDSRQMVGLEDARKRENVEFELRKGTETFRGVSHLRASRREVVSEARGTASEAIVDGVDEGANLRSQVCNGVSAIARRVPAMLTVVQNLAVHYVLTQALTQVRRPFPGAVGALNSMDARAKRAFQKMPFPGAAGLVISGSLGSRALQAFVASVAASAVQWDKDRHASHRRLGAGPGGGRVVLVRVEDAPRTPPKDTTAGKEEWTRDSKSVGLPPETSIRRIKSLALGKRENEWTSDIYDLAGWRKREYVEMIRENSLSSGNEMSNENEVDPTTEKTGWISTKA
ncbi:hypothetical protein DFH09DRAFT_1067482 [Mycena vulgaris]|nr:hypothetical protein DFH09DRAFT_1067482 [Mycena vulgaris]